jgi:hypothetical protein
VVSQADRLQLGEHRVDTFASQVRLDDIPWGTYRRPWEQRQLGHTDGSVKQVHDLADAIGRADQLQVQHRGHLGGVLSAR